MQAAGKRYVHYRRSRPTKFRLWNLSDLHVGNRGCSESRIKQDVAKIAEDDHAYWIGGGDYGDFIGYRDKRFDPTAMATWMQLTDLADIGEVTMDRVAQLLDPIKGKCLGLLQGNHERKRALQTEHERLHTRLCEAMRAPSLEYCALFDIVFCGVTGGPTTPALKPGLPKGKNWTSDSFRVFCHHGAGGASSPAGKLTRLIQFMQSFEADLYFIGHVHDRVARKEPIITASPGCTEITERERLGCIAGSYLRTYTQGSTGYGEVRAYRPVSLGASIVEITPMKREVVAEV